MSEVRFIDANALSRAIKTECNPYGKPTIDFESGKKVLKIIERAPTVKPYCYFCGQTEHGKIEERPQGEWTNKHFEHADCSLCGRTNDYHGDFCKYCGADMRKVVRNEV